jgi:hypothetical protein
MNVGGQVLSILASGSPVCWAMRASSGDTAGDSRSGGGARSAAPSIPTCLASWVYNPMNPDVSPSRSLPFEYF